MNTTHTPHLTHNSQVAPQIQTSKQFHTVISNDESAKTLFQKSSTTYFYSSVFFPHLIKAKINNLYAFVRVADNYVDAVPQDKAGFLGFKNEYLNRRNSSALSPNPVISAFTQLEQSNEFDPAWTEAFLNSMEMDLTNTTYKTFEELDEYIYGSAEVIGLYLSKLLSLPVESYPYAQKLGKAMQYINFLRDINEDIGLGRIYIPLSELAKHNIKVADFTTAKLTNELKEQFNALIKDQIQIFLKWQKEAEEGFSFIPRKYRIAIKTASEMYKYTASVISKNPQIVFQKKVKPSKRRVFARALLESVSV